MAALSKGHKPLFKLENMEAILGLPGKTKPDGPLS